METIKLIWDFRGETANHTAQHHAIHLKEFLTNQNILNCKTGFENITDLHATAFITCPKSLMLFFRDKLKPHRAQVLH